MKVLILLSVLTLSNCASTSTKPSVNSILGPVYPVKNVEKTLFAIPVEPIQITKSPLTKEEKAIQDCLNEADKLRIVFLYDRGVGEFNNVAKTLDDKRTVANRLLSKGDVRRKLLNQVVDKYRDLFVLYAFDGRDAKEPREAFFFAQLRHRELVKLINGTLSSEEKEMLAEMLKNKIGWVDERANPRATFYDIF